MEALEKSLMEKFPQYKVRLLKNPLMSFQYVEVKKSGTVGVWVRIMDKKDQVWLISCMPSPIARALLGLIFVFFFIGAQKKLNVEVGTVIKETFNTSEV